tara:strand:- start:15 stop:203 length:189 start_codon:yes stop_codon:yes gene_type:complete
MFTGNMYRVALGVTSGVLVFVAVIVDVIVGVGVVMVAEGVGVGVFVGHVWTGASSKHSSQLE